MNNPAARCGKFFGLICSQPDGYDKSRYLVEAFAKVEIVGSSPLSVLRTTFPRRGQEATVEQ